MKYLIILTLLVMGPFVQSQSWSHIYGQLNVLDVVEHQNDLWIATDQGLIKMDQSTLQTTHYTTDNSVLPDNHIQTISLDIAGNIWIGTYDLALVRIDPTNNTWNVHNYPASVQGIPTSGIRIYCSDIAPDGSVWLGTSKGLLSFDGTTWGWTTIGQVPIWDITISSTGQIDMASLNFLTYDIALDSWTEHHHPSLPSNNIASNEAHLVRQNDSTLFLFANSIIAGPVHRIQNGVWTSWNNALGAGSGSSSVPITPRYNGLRPTIAPNGYIYYNLYTEHLVYFDGTQWLVDSSLTTQNTALNHIDHCFFSNNGDLWAFRDNISVKHNTTATTNDILLPLVNFNHLTKSTLDINNDFYLTASVHVGIQKHDNGNWLPLVGSENYHNHRNTKFDLNNNAWFISKNTTVNEPTIMQQNGSTWYRHDHTSSGGVLPSVGSFYDIEVSSTGAILARDHEDNLYKFVNNTWSLIASVPVPSEVFASAMSTDIFGNVWWVERHVASLSSYDYFLKKYDGNTIQSTLNNQLRFVKPYLDESGHLWTSFGQGQLNKYDGTSWTNYTFVSNAHVAHIVGRNGTIFLGTTNEGIYKFDGLNWTNFKESNSPLTYNDCRGLQLDGTGNLWIQNALGAVIDIYDTGLVISSTNAIDNEAILDLAIAPNPSSDQININCPLEEIQSIAIINAMGQKVVDLKNSTTQMVNITALPQGIYWVVANNKQAQIRRAFVKQ